VARRSAKKREKNGSGQSQLPGLRGPAPSSTTTRATSNASIRSMSLSRRSTRSSANHRPRGKAPPAGGVRAE